MLLSLSKSWRKMLWLNENGFHTLRCLNNCFLAGVTLWERLEVWPFWRRCIRGMGLLAMNASGHAQGIFYFLPDVQKVSSRGLPAAKCSLCQQRLWLWTHKTNLLLPFIHWLGHGVSYHSERKVTIQKCSAEDQNTEDSPFKYRNPGKFVLTVAVEQVPQTPWPWG